MARQPRLKVHGRQGNYHVVTRVRGRDFLLDDHMKKYFIYTIKKLKELFYVRYLAFCSLSNHYHLLLKCEPPESIDPQEAMDRWNSYHRAVYRLNDTVSENRGYVVEELTDISGFMKRLNMHLTREYNRHADAEGTLWERRFRSTIVSSGWAAVKTAAYIDLNSFRASLTPRPEDYPYSSLNHLKRGNPLGLLDMEEIEKGIKRSRLYAGEGRGSNSNQRSNRRGRGAGNGIDDESAAEGLSLQAGPAKGSIEKSRSQGMSREKKQEIYDIYLAVVYRLGTTPHRGEHGIPEEGGIVITEQMQKSLLENGITEQAAPRGSFAGRVVEYTRGKFIGVTEDDARRFYEENIASCSLEDETSEGTVTEAPAGGLSSGLERWIKKIGPGQWSVCSTRAVGERKALPVDRHNNTHQRDRGSPG